MFQSTLQDVKVVLEGRKFSPADVVQCLKSPDLATKTLAARAACRMQQRHWNLLVLVEAGFIPPLAEALGSKGCTDLQLAAATCLARFCVCHAAAVADGGCIPALVGALRALPAAERGASSAVGKQAAEALRRIALKGAVYRDDVLRAGGLWAMLPHMQADTPLALLRSTVNAYYTMCNSRDPRAEVVELSPALPYIADLLLKTHDELVLTITFSALNSLTSDDPSAAYPASPAYVEAVVSTPELAARLVQLLLRPDYAAKRSPLVVLYNLLGGTDSQRQRCLDAGCLIPIIACLSRSDETVCKYKARLEYAALAISRLACVCAGSPGSPASPGLLAGLLAPACLRPYCALLAADYSPTVKHVLDGLTGLLQAATKDGTVEDVCLQLELAGAVEHIQRLQHHEDDEVYEKNRHLIVEYFGEEEPEDPDE